LENSIVEEAISDKFGDETLITMTDPKRAAAYVNVLRDIYMENMKIFANTSLQK